MEERSYPLRFVSYRRCRSVFPDYYHENEVVADSTKAAVLGPAIAPINKMLVDEFKTTYKVTAKFSGWQFWPAGIAGLFGSAVGRVWGKRPVYIVSTLLLFIGAIWNALAQNTDSFLGARILQVSIFPV